MDQPSRETCPHCFSSEGYVRRLTIAPDDQRTLTYICASCKKSWDSEPHIPDSTDTRMMFVSEQRQKSVS